MPLSRPVVDFRSLPIQGLSAVVISFAWLWGLTSLGLTFGYPALLIAFASFVVAFAIPRMAIGLLIAGLFFQGCLTALGVPSMPEGNSINVPQANSVIFGIACGAIGLLVLFFGDRGPGYRNLAITALVPLGLVALFSIYGLTVTSVPSVAAYIRVFASGWLFFLLAISIGGRAQQTTVFWVVYFMAIPLMIYGVVEAVQPAWIYEVFNIPDYLHVKMDRGGEAMDAAVAAEMMGRNFLNLSGDFSTGIRLSLLSGPNIHVITFGYICSILSTYMFVNRRFFLAIMLMLLMILAGSKGALVLFVMYFAVSVGRKTRVGLHFGWIFEVAVYCAYVFVFMIYGQITKDYHYLGVMGAVRGFLDYPLGYGIGVGGNLSDLNEARDFATFQRQGYANYAVETGLGTLVYQLGIFAAGYLWALWRIVVLLSKQAIVVDGIARKRTDWARIMLTGVIVNSLFQEEAFSPAIWGFIMLMCGLTLRQNLIINRGRVPGPGPRPGRSGGPARAAYRTRSAAGFPAGTLSDQPARPDS